MRKFVIFGDSSFAERLSLYIERENNAKVIAFTQEQNFIQRTFINGIPVIPFEKLKPSKNYSILIGVGYSKMNGLREAIYKIVKNKGYKIGKFISKNALLYIDERHVGEGTFVCPGVYVGPNCSIGVCNIFETGSILAHDNTLGNFNYFSIGAVIAGKTLIQNNCFFGSNSSVIDNIIVNNRTLVGAGANVIKFDSTYDGGGVFIGNPAKIIVGKKSINTNI